MTTSEEHHESSAHVVVAETADEAKRVADEANDKAEMAMEKAMETADTAYEAAAKAVEDAEPVVEAAPTEETNEDEDRFKSFESKLDGILGRLDAYESRFEELSKVREDDGHGEGDQKVPASPGIIEVATEDTPDEPKEEEHHEQSGKANSRSGRRFTRGKR